MTEVGARRICELATQTFGEKVVAQVVVNRRNQFAAALKHKQLGRAVKLTSIDDWPFLRFAWLAVTTD